MHASPSNKTCGEVIELLGTGWHAVVHIALGVRKIRRMPP